MSDFVESLANAVSNPTEVISTEDTLSKIKACNTALERRRKEKELKGEVMDEMVRELYTLVSDVVALFPSMTAVKTGKVAREQAVKTSMIVDRLDYKGMARYA